MKILFIMYDNQSARNHMPVGPCYVAAYVKKHGYDDIAFYNQDVYHYSEEHLTKYLSDNKFDIAAIGFVAGYYQFKKIKDICSAINKAENRPFIVLGGHGPSPEPGFFIEATGSDAIVMGEGEVPFLNLVKALENKSSLKNVKGIAYKDNDRIVINEREQPIKDLDSIPFPYYELLPIEYYVNAKLFGMRPTERMIYMVSTRGCNYFCNFCLRMEKGIRFRSPGNVVEEIQKYKTDYGISYIHFIDELFMFSEKRVFEMTEAFLKADLGIKYFCTGRLNTVTQKMLTMLKRSGCVYVDYGIEQFDNDALTAMDKRLLEEEIVRGIELTQKENFPIIFDIIFGNIGDTRQSLRKTLDFMKKYNDYGQLRTIRPVTPYPGSPLYYHAIEKGLLKGPADFYEKHKNLELPTVNFTNIPDDEYLQLLFDANKELAADYYEHMKSTTIDDFRKVYFEKNYDFRGVRH